MAYKPKLLEIQASIGGQMKVGDMVYDRDLELVGVVLDIDDDTGLIWVQFAYKLQTEWCYRSRLEVLCK